MMINKPVVTTAKVRGLIKKNNLGYVDATRRLFPNIALGISVWQLCDHIFFEVYGYNSDVRAAEILAQFETVLAAEGFAVRKCSNSYEIVKAA